MPQRHAERPLMIAATRYEHPQVQKEPKTGSPARCRLNHHMPLFRDMDVELTERRDINDDATDIECDAPSVQSHYVLDENSHEEKDGTDDEEEYECVAKLATEDLGGESVVCFQF